MSRTKPRPRLPWLGLAGSGLILLSLLLAPRPKLSGEEELKVIKISREQVKSAVETMVSEDPSLQDDRERLMKQAKEAALAQALLVEEAFAQGIAKSDYIVRNRLVEMQVMQLYERADAQVTPEAAREYFEKHRDKYVTLPRRFYHHLFVPVTNLVSEEEALRRLEAEFRDEASWDQPRWVTEADLRKAYGPSIARKVFEMPLGEWSEPYRSPLGWHRFLVLDEEPSRQLEFEEAETRATEDLRRELRRKMYEQEIERLKKKYRVEFTK